MRSLRTVLAMLLLGSAALPGQPRQSEAWTAPERAQKQENPVEATRSSVRQGAMLYRGQCLLCHGEKGRGDGPWVEQLPRKPADLTDGRLSKMTDGELFWKISRGRFEMPRFETKLSERQRWHLVNYLRALVEESRTRAKKPGD